MPTAYTGMVHSYTDTTAHVRCIEDLIHNISPDEVPLTKFIGINSIADPAVFSTTYEWLEDELAPTASALAESIASTTTTTCAVTAASGTWFRSGHILLIDDELVRVTSVSTDTLTIGRAFGGTTAATHANLSVVDVVGIALIEGADAPDSFKMDVSTGYNYTQIFQETVQVSGTQQQLKQYGIKSELPYQVAKKFTEMARLLERSLFSGYRAVGSSSTARAFGGLKVFVTDNTTNKSSAAVTEKDVMDSLQAIFDDVGQGNKANLIVCNGWVKRKLTSFYAPYARMERAERTGGVVVDELDTEFGRIDVMLNTWCPTDEMWILNTDYLAIGPMQGRAFFQEELSKAGDYTKVQVIGEYTFKCPNDKAHAYIYGISTSL